MKRARRSRLQAALFLGVGLASTGLGLVAYGTNVFRELELDTVDARFSIRGTETAPPEIEVVAIDDITFSDFNSNKENDPVSVPAQATSRRSSTVSPRTGRK